MPYNIIEDAWEVTHFRIPPELKSVVDKFMILHEEKYDSLSHMYRIAVIKHIKEVDLKLWEQTMERESYRFEKKDESD